MLRCSVTTTTVLFKNFFGSKKNESMFMPIFGLFSTGGNVDLLAGAGMSVVKSFLGLMCTVLSFYY